MRCFALSIALLAGSPGVLAVNSYAEVHAGSYITWMSGNMLVPEKPAASSQGNPEGPMYLWPGLDFGGQDCGLFQPVLGYSDGNGEWWISNWFSNCPGVAGGYCHDPANTVYPGDKIYFWMRQISGMQYEMGYQTNRGTTAKIQYPCHTRLPRSAWLIEQETYFNLAGAPQNEKFLPRSPFVVTDVTVRDQNNQEVGKSGDCHQTNEQQLSCNWAAGRFDQSYPYAGVSNLTSSAPLEPLPVVDCQGNAACESVQGRVPGGTARALFAARNRTAVIAQQSTEEVLV